MKTLSKLFSIILLVALALNLPASTITGPLKDPFGRNITNVITFKPTSLVVVGSTIYYRNAIAVYTDTNGAFSVSLSPGNWTAQIGPSSDVASFSVPNDSSTYALATLLPAGLLFSQSIGAFVSTGSVGTINASIFAGNVTYVNIASNLVYTNDDGIGVCVFPVTIGTSYYYLQNPADGNNVLVITGTAYDYSTGFIGYGTFLATRTNVAFLSDVTSGPVGDKLYIAVTNYGNFFGNFVGTVSIGSTIDPSALPSTVVLNNQPLNVTSSGSSQHILFVTNSSLSSGSTLGLVHAGNYGYSDINFYTQAGNVGTRALRFALGVGVQGTNQGSYNTPYLEDYNAEGFFFVTGGQRLYGLYDTGNFHRDWVGYQYGNGNTNLYFDFDQSNNVLHLASFDLTNAPELHVTNTTPGGFSASSPKTFFSVTNGAGQVFSIPGY
jgi:hypothetical protein